jgi:hypothetical protein
VLEPQPGAAVISMVPMVLWWRTSDGRSRHALVIIAAVILHPDWVAPLARDSEEMRWQHKGTMNYNCRTNRRTSWNGSARRRGWAVIADRDLCHSGGPHGHAV